MPTYTNISITTATGLSYKAGDYVQLSNDPNNYIVGEVVSYNKNTGAMTLTPTLFVGSGTYTSWNVNLTGVQGTSGTTGTSGTSGSAASSGSSGTNGVSGSTGTSGLSAGSFLIQRKGWSLRALQR